MASRVSGVYTRYVGVTNSFVNVDMELAILLQLSDKIIITELLTLGQNVASRKHATEFFCELMVVPVCYLCMYLWAGERGRRRA